MKKRKARPPSRTDRARARAKVAIVKKLGSTANVSAACRSARVGRRTAYEWREADATFKAAWDDAIEAATDELEAEARRRAVKGWNEPIYHQGRKVGAVRKYSDRMLEILLKGHRPEKFRERVDLKHSGRLTLEQLVEQSRKPDDGG